MESCASQPIGSSSPPAEGRAWTPWLTGVLPAAVRTNMAAAAAAAVSGALLGWVLAFGWLASVGARARFVGSAVPLQPDAAVGFGVALAAAAVARRLGQTRRGVAAAGFGGAAAVAAAAGCALAGCEPGSAPVLLPFVGALGVAAAIGGTAAAGAHRAWIVWALAAGFAAAGSAAVWPSIEAWIGHRATLAAGALPLLLANCTSGPAPRPRAGWRRAAIGAAAALAAGFLTWLAVPGGLWAAAGGPEVVGFVGCAAAVAALVRVGAPWCALGAAALFCAVMAPVGPGDPTTSRVLAGNGATQAVYARATQELQLWSNGALVDGEGPDRPQSELTATLLGALLAPGDRVLLLGLGAGRLPARLASVGPFVVDVADGRADAFPLLPHLAGVGPVAPRAAPPDGLPKRAVRGPQRALAALPDGARQAIVIAEPLHARSQWQVDVAAQIELRRVAGKGLVVQPFAMDRTPPSRLRALLGAAVAAHAWNGVVAVGDCALLVSADEPLDWPQGAQFAGFDRAARWQAHAAHLGGPDDLQRAWLGTVAARLVADAGRDEPPAVAADGGDRAGVLDVLRGSLEPPPPILAADDSVLLRWIARESDLRALQRRLLHADGKADAAARAEAQAAAARYLPIGAPKAFLQAALGLPDGNGVRLRAAAAASLCAHAIDPTLFGPSRPPLFGELPAPLDPTGPLEDLAALPPPERLAELCSGESPMAVALRARFPSPCASALVEALARGPLSPDGAQALRELADPFVLAEAGAVLAARSGVRELLALWRGGLPMPAPLRELGAGGIDDRRLLVAALAGRRDAGSLQVLADSLADPDLALRKIAATALRATVGDRVAYDPEWERSRLLAAAERLRAMHNRAP